MKTKHADASVASSTTLDLDSFGKLCSNSLTKLADDETLPESVLAEYEKYALGADDVSHAFSSVMWKMLLMIFFIDGDSSVKFFPSFHNCIQIADCVFPRLSTDACLFLGFELTNHVAAYRSHGHIFGDEGAEKLNIQDVDGGKFTQKENDIISLS